MKFVNLLGTAAIVLAIAACYDTAPRAATTHIPVPADEAAVIGAVISARQKYDNGANDMAKGASRPARKDDLCAIIKSKEVHNWTGKIVKLTPIVKAKVF